MIVGLVCSIQSDPGRVESSTCDDGRRLGIDEDVELRVLGHIAAPKERPAHDDEPIDPVAMRGSSLSATARFVSGPTKTNAISPRCSRGQSDDRLRRRRLSHGAALYRRLPATQSVEAVMLARVHSGRTSGSLIPR